MFHLVLYQPEIPPNTGNIIRLCANTGASLHLIKPLGFRLTDRRLRRAGLDYHEIAHVALYENWERCQEHFSGRRLFAVTTRGKQRYDEVLFSPGDVFVFGPETRGLPPSLLESFPQQNRIRLPMLPHNRSLNLANAAAVVIYEAWRQAGFKGGQ
ncbi:MAG TPA: tRNA (uridine(34)/cytosine(34)/5-carboxymethylaminomethyluridine(34)-2'-O)-methyltransferase TrmL [Burkholderiales bacterium]|nr:tRNA (uridine(34)/cytosine(34)/5-carboxymethylaminomethyluridine(34)-2'-O)-methyltransferase TrmL [Burkholderiales bacterium]